MVVFHYRFEQVVVATHCEPSVYPRGRKYVLGECEIWGCICSYAVSYSGRGAYVIECS